MSRPGAEDRLRRILAVVPWVVAADGPRVAEVCARFDYPSEKAFHDDINLLFLCGVPPYTPDALIEVDLADDRVWIRYADWFSRPLRLTPAEALTLVAASSALSGGVGTGRWDDPRGDPDSPLSRGLAKLAGVLGVSDEVVDVTLGPTPSGVLATLREGAAGHRQVEIDYYGYGRDRRTTRVVDPHLVYAASGQWYLAAYCHRARADRLFRVDRVERATLLDRTFEARPGTEAPPLFDPTSAAGQVVLDLEPGGAWAAERYPTAWVTERGGGRLRVALWVTGDAWLARLLLRLGPDAAVVEGEPGGARELAARVAERYQGRGPRPADDPVPSGSS